MDTNETRYVAEQIEEPHKPACCNKLPDMPAGMLWGAVAGATAALVVGFITIAIVSGIVRRATTTEKLRRIRRNLLKRINFDR